MCHTQELYLYENKIRDAGLTALAEAVESGALAQLTRLDLDRNRIGDAGLTALAEAIKPTADNASGALANLTILGLGENKIGDIGLEALAKAITPDKDGKGALDNLQVCWRPTALSPCPETRHMHYPDSYLLFDVPYAGALSRREPDWRRRPHRSRQGG